MTASVKPVESVQPGCSPEEGKTLQELTRRIEAEFREMPGLSVTLPQAQRLWCMDYATSIGIFRLLTDRGVVRRTPRGQYIRG